MLSVETERFAMEILHHACSFQLHAPAFARLEEWLIHGLT